MHQNIKMLKKQAWHGSFSDKPSHLHRIVTIYKTNYMTVVKKYFKSYFLFLLLFRDY